MEVHCAGIVGAFAPSDAEDRQLSNDLLSDLKAHRLPSFLYRLLFPNDAYSAEVSSETVNLCTPRAARVIYLKDITEVSLSTGLFRTTVYIHGPFSRIAVSGLPRSDATTLAEALKTAQIGAPRPS